MKKEHYTLLALTIFFLVFTRLIPHPPNFTPILATCIFAGMKFKGSSVTPCPRGPDRGVQLLIKLTRPADLKNKKNVRGIPQNGPKLL